MAGRKQHYIPQSILRGFGATGGGAKVQVNVYDGTRGIFIAATDGVAAERHFYSELSVEGDEPTLDDRITNYEGRMAEVVHRMRVSTDGGVNAGEAAELVTHLSIRNGHLRSSFRSAAESLVGEAEDLFTDRERSRAAFGLDRASPTGLVAEELDKMWDQWGPLLQARGISKDALFGMMKSQFESGFAELSATVNNALGTVKAGVRGAAERGHRQALNQTLAPEARMEVLRQFAWTIEAAPEEGAILPDCVVVADTAEGPTPLMYCNNEDVLAVYMPLSHDQILVGRREGQGGLPDQVNEVFASCSWDFFVARDRSEALEALLPSIRTRTKQITDEAIKEALADYE